MNRSTRPNRKDLDRSRIERCLAGLDDAISRCRTEDVRYGTGLFAALKPAAWGRMRGKSPKTKLLNS